MEEYRRLCITVSLLENDLAYLALVRYTGVESIMQSITFEVDVIRDPIVERVVCEVVSVQLSWQVGVKYVVNLRYPS